MRVRVKVSPLIETNLLVPPFSTIFSQTIIIFSQNMDMLRRWYYIYYCNIVIDCKLLAKNILLIVLI